MQTQTISLDILVLAVHPDDAELGCAGTLIKHIRKGDKVGIVDLTRGELGTRGTAETRKEEARRAADIMGLSVRENLGMRDGFFINDEAHQKQIIQIIRKYRPRIVITNAYTDRHPDHGRACALVSDAVFLSGLRRIETHQGTQLQEAFRPELLLHFIQDYYIKPDIVVDISSVWPEKIKAIQAYTTQFFTEDQDSSEPQTYISKSGFMEGIAGRAREFGKYIQAEFAEGFTCKRLLGVEDLSVLR